MPTADLSEATIACQDPWPLLNDQMQQNHPLFDIEAALIIVIVFHEFYVKSIGHDSETSETNCVAECCIDCYSTIELLRVWIEITFKITIRVTIQLLRHGPLVIVIGTCCYIYIRLKYYICGRAQAVSGKTIMIGNETVRINGIVALRQGQMLHFKSGEWKNGFQYSKQALAKMVDGKRVCCRVTKRHGAYGRAEGVCSVWFRDIGKGMVRQGYAFADREYSERYVGDEKYARRKRKGFHAAVPPPVNPRKKWDEAEKEARDFLVGRFRERRLSSDPSVMTINELSVELGFEFNGGVIIDPGGELIPIELV